MGTWVSVDGSAFLRLLGPFSREGVQFVNVGFVCVAVGALMLLLGLLGCCAAHRESKCLLLLVGRHWGSEVRATHPILEAPPPLSLSLSPSLQFFSIVLVIFVAEVAAAVVALAYSSFVSSSSSSSSSQSICALLVPSPRHFISVSICHRRGDRH